MSNNKIKMTGKFLAAAVAILLIWSVTAIQASATETCCDGGDCCILNDCVCPSCYGREDKPGEDCSRCGGDTCDNCGNCFDCGTSPCPECKTGDELDVCETCGSRELCAGCTGCLDCGNLLDSECPFHRKADAEITDTVSEVAPKPLFTIGGVDVYLFAPVGTPAWSLFNLIAAVLGVTAVAAVFVKAVMQKSRENKAEEGKHGELLRSTEQADNEKLIEAVEGKERYNIRRRLWSIILSSLFSVSAVVLLIVTHDFNGVIALFDAWSIVHAAMAIGAVAFGILAFRRYIDDLD